jgi:hypothetical protein
MGCAECGSNNRRELGTEMMIHHAGFPNGRADVLVVPVAWVCLDCGFSTFSVPLVELQELRDGDRQLPITPFSAYFNKQGQGRPVSTHQRNSTPLPTTPTAAAHRVNRNS